MKYNKLGHSALTISEIGFGCMSLKGTKKENTTLIHSALDSGINFFDTADIYQHGINEKEVGAAILERRKDIVLATKAGNVWKEDGSGLDWNPRKDHILASVEQSLQRLQTDYIDLYQLHGGTIQDNIDESIEAFEYLKQQGKIRYYGISSIRPNVIREYVQRSDMVSVMMQYSLLDRRPEETCFSLLEENNISVLVRGSLAQGLLINKPPKDYLGYTAAQVAQAAAAIHEASDSNRKATQTAIRFVLQQPVVASVVLGISNPEQLGEALATCESPALSEPETQLLKSALPANYYKEHR